MMKDLLSARPKLMISKRKQELKRFARRKLYEKHTELGSTKYFHSKLTEKTKLIADDAFECTHLWRNKSNYED